MVRALFLGLMVLAVSACATETGKQRFTGTLEWSFETSAFRTDAGEGPWWLSADRGVWDAVVAPLRGAGSPYGRVHLTVEGVLSAPGRYGHMSAYARTLRVTRVIDAQLITAAGAPPGS